MHYLEDLIEYLDDLPEELQHRMEQIRKWDTEVEMMRSECRALEIQLFEEENALSVEEKEKLAFTIAEKLGRMKNLSEKKSLLAERCCILLDKLYKKASESVEAFQLELAVDNPGVAQVIEEKFKRDVERRQQAEQFSKERRTPFESDESGRSTPDFLVPNLAERRNILKERNNRSRYGKGNLAATTIPIDGGVKKKVGRRPGKDGKISHYMRKKLEREREQQKLMEIHAKREEERKKRESVVTPPPANFDMSAFCAQGRSTTTPNKETPLDNKDLPSGEEDDDDGLSLFAGLADMIGPDDQIRDDIDLNTGSFNLLSHLGREELEIIDSMNTGSAFSLDDDMVSGLGAASSSQSPMYVHSAFSGGSSTVTSSPSPIKPVPSTSTSSFNEAIDDRKKKKIMFSSTSDTSMHGRPRKLTDRAAQKLQQNMQKHNSHLRKHKEMDEGSDSADDAYWCYCRQPSYGCMIACDAEHCKFRWFHLDCVGLEAVPEGTWFCKSCHPPLDNKEQLVKFP